MYKLVIIAAEDIRIYEFNSKSVAEQVKALVIKWNLKAELFEDMLEEKK